MNEAILKQIIEDKQNGLSDKNIGNKYGVNLKFIEKVITEKIGINVTNPVINKTQIRTLSPKNFKPERNTVWSFKSRGNWATHNGNYRGNWSPYIPRNILLRYSNESDLILDYFCGAGSTAVECKLLNRNFIGIDINPKAIELAKLNLDFNIDNDSLFKTNIQLEYGDARNLNIANNTIDLICAHPPYADIIHYTHENPDDLSNLKIEEFLSAMDKVAKESYRVLKDNKYCVILIGDMRKNKNVIPLGFWVMEKFLNNGFQIQELIIKRQHNCKTTGFWYKNSIKYNFLLLAHEYLIVFRKQKNRDNHYFHVNKTASCNEDLKQIGQVIKKDIDLESKTVWIFNKKNWLENAISNLILRYADKNYLIYNDYSNCFNTTKDKRFNLIILQNENKIIKNLNTFNDSLTENGILAIICEDIRLKDGLIYSPAIKIEKFLRNVDKFKIKEIILLTLENDTPFKEDKFLEINHKYILIYKKN
jgi:DNA modification methylase